MVGQEQYHWRERVRGLVLGLAIGDTLGSGKGAVGSEGRLRAGCPPS